MENLEKLIRELVTLGDETQWVEFKHNNYDPVMIGEDISALANGATLQDKEKAYFLWGIDNNKDNSNHYSSDKIGRRQPPGFVR